MNIKTANRLQQLRKQHGYSQEELASLLNVSRQAVSKWECAEASPDTDNLIAIAELYNISIDELINGETIKTESATKEQFYPQSCRNNDEEFTPQQKIILSIVGGATVLIATIAYFTIWLGFNISHPTWIVFMLIPITTSLASAIIKRNPTHFALPVLMAAIYLLIGFLTGLWHPYWFIFLLIPLYYIICDCIKHAKIKKSKKNK